MAVDIEQMTWDRDIHRRYKSEWAIDALYTIIRADRAMPEGATFEQRKKAIDAAYPYGPRKYHPYKQWLKVRRDYLASIDPKAAGPLLA